MIKKMMLRRKRLSFPRERLFSRRRVWHSGQVILYLLLGTTLAALGYALFQIPFNIVAGGLSGVGIILNYFTGWPVGLVYWLLNLPMLAVGFFYLGRWRFVISTLVASTLFAALIDLFGAVLPALLEQFPVTENVLLASLYSGVIGGIGTGFVYRAGSTFGSTGVIGRIIQQKTGLPLSQVYLFTDGAIILGAGFVFGWEIALYGFFVLFIHGLASDYTLEGPSSTRTVTIITNRPQEMADAIIQQVGRGASYWEVTGGYTGTLRYMVLCTIYRSQVNAVKRVAAQVEPEAFLTIGVSHQALGTGFKRLREE